MDAASFEIYAYRSCEERGAGSDPAHVRGVRQLPIGQAGIRNPVM